ncbi:MAG: methyltransferase domain-containing protein [Candidatus Doudnabacteria bacterium]|nr:methyltransferase domain-containing protein [Candidatus Doudnabacteria bacterium]
MRTRKISRTSSAYTLKAKFADILYHDFENQQLEFLKRELSKLAQRAQACFIDAGCGTGRLTGQVADELRVQVIGLDSSAHMIHRARQLNTSNRTAFKVGELEHIRGNNQYDAIFIMFTVFNYITDPRKAKKAIRSLYQNLTPGGKLIIDAANILNYIDCYKPKITNKFKRAEGTYTQEISHLVDKQEMLMHHFERFITPTGGIIKEHHALKFYPKDILQEFLEQAGFSAKKIKFLFNYSTRKPNNNYPRIIAVATK